MKYGGHAVEFCLYLKISRKPLNISNQREKRSLYSMEKRFEGSQ